MEKAKVDVEPVIDIDEYRRAILGQLSQEQNRELRRKELLEKTLASIAKGNEVTLTDEMRELGIYQELWVACRKADLAKKMKSLMEDDD